MNIPSFQKERNSLKNITSCFPQGTKLGPAISSVMVNDAAETIPLIDGNLSTISPWLKYVIPKILISFNNDWCKVNDMLPKPSKCHVMHVDFVKSPFQLPQLSLGGEALQVAEHMKFLGLEMQNNLGCDIHVKNVISRAGRRLFILYTLRKCWPSFKLTSGLFWNTLAAVWHSALTKQQSHQLERIQKTQLQTHPRQQLPGLQSALQYLNT